jgi:hypothetical protein
MRRTDWLLAGLLALLIVAAVSILLLLRDRNEPVETIQEVFHEPTAMNAYTSAEPVARKWAADAALYSITTALQSPLLQNNDFVNWDFTFYSPELHEAALLSINDSQVTLISTRSAQDIMQTGNLADWRVDSPAAIGQMMAVGGEEFLQQQGQATLVLALRSSPAFKWKGTLVNTGTHATLGLEISAENGELERIQRTR